MITIQELDLKQVLKLFWDRKILIVIVVILFAMIGGLKIKYFTTPEYQASGKLICGRREESIRVGNMVTSTDITMPASLSETYTELIKSDLILNQVIENLHLDMSAAGLRSKIELTPLTTVYYQVSARSNDRNQAADIANELIKVFSEQIKTIYEIDNINIIDKAQIPTSATNMDLKKSVLVFSGIGLVVAITIIMIMYSLNDTVTNSEQIKSYTKLPTLATIPKFSGDDDLITLKDSKSPYAEAIKILRTNLQYMYNGDKLKTVAITSSLPGEGKSWLTANLAVAFANTGKRTLIIDADMRKGRQHKMFKVRKMPGLSEFLRATKDNSDIISINGKKVASSALAKIFAFVNRFIKIERIPAISKIIYEDDIFTMSIDNKEKTKMKSLKKENFAKEVEIQVGTNSKKRKIAKVSKVEDFLKARQEKINNRDNKVVHRVGKAVKEDIERQINEESERRVVEPNVFEFIRKTKIDNLYILSSGSERLESSELLSNKRFEGALEKLKQKFDIIIVDTPPVSIVSDGFIISRVVDTNIIVLKHGNTEIKELNKIKNNIQEIGGKVIGTVINKIPNVNSKYYHTYYNKKG